MKKKKKKFIDPHSDGIYISIAAKKNWKKLYSAEISEQEECTNFIFYDIIIYITLLITWMFWTSELCDIPLMLIQNMQVKYETFGMPTIDTKNSWFSMSQD